MAVFFNQKEEVINFKLTPHGRHLFSQGKLAPDSYVFYDDGILYDGIYGGIIENQNNIVTRIKNQTPYLKPIIPMSSSNNQVESVGLEISRTTEITPSNSNFFKPLGTNSPWSEFNPSWNVTTMRNSVPFEGYNYLAQGLIPNLTSSVIELEYGTLDVEQPLQGEQPLEILEKEGRFYIDVLELNTIFKIQGNYDIEVYRVPNDEQESIVPLSFINDNSLYYQKLEDQSRDPYSILNTMSGDDDVQRQYFPRLTPDYVEYYLEIRVDGEIIDAPEITPASLYVTNGKTPNIVCDDVNVYGVDR